jgi:hypothetical protein
MSKQATELVEIIAKYPHWLRDEEKRQMIVKMAMRIAREREVLIRNDDNEIKKGVKV